MKIQIFIPDTCLKIHVINPISNNKENCLLIAMKPSTIFTLNIMNKTSAQDIPVPMGNFRVMLPVPIGNFPVMLPVPIFQC